MAFITDLLNHVSCKIGNLAHWNKQKQPFILSWKSINGNENINHICPKTKPKPKVYFQKVMKDSYRVPSSLDTAINIFYMIRKVLSYFLSPGTWFKAQMLSQSTLGSQGKATLLELRVILWNWKSRSKLVLLGQLLIQKDSVVYWYRLNKLNYKPVLIPTTLSNFSHGQKASLPATCERVKPVHIYCWDSNWHYLPVWRMNLDY